MHKYLEKRDKIWLYLGKINAMKKILFTLLCILLTTFVYSQTNNLEEKENTKSEGSGHFLIDAANIFSGGIKYKGAGIYILQQTAPNDTLGYKEQEKKALEKVLKFTTLEEVNYEILTIEKKPAPLGIGAVRCLVTFKVYNKDGTSYYNKIDRDAAKKELEELKKLKEEGLIDEDEYKKAAEPAKKILLGK